MKDATPSTQPQRCNLRGVGPDPWGLGVSQPDLYGHFAPYSETWPTSGTTHDGSAYPLPTLAHHIQGSVSSSWPGALFRTPWPRTRRRAARHWTKYGRGSARSR